MNLIDQLNRDEGRRKWVYKDTVGKLTVGVGRNINDVPFSDDEIDLMLNNDIRLRQDILGHLPWFTSLDPVRAAAIVNMSFMGVDKLLRFTHMIDALAKQDWITAMQEMQHSLWAEQVGLRALRLERQILTGEWQ